MKKMSKIVKKYEQISKLQVRKFDEKERFSIYPTDEEVIDE